MGTRPFPLRGNRNTLRGRSPAAPAPRPWDPKVQHWTPALDSPTAEDKRVHCSVWVLPWKKLLPEYSAVEVQVAAVKASYTEASHCTRVSVAL